MSNYLVLLIINRYLPTTDKEFDVILSTGSKTEGLFARCVLKLFRVEGGASTGVPPWATVVYDIH